jgi:hypothetical protein
VPVRALLEVWVTPEPTITVKLNGRLSLLTTSFSFRTSRTPSAIVCSFLVLANFTVSINLLDIPPNRLGPRIGKAKLKKRRGIGYYQKAD